MKERLIELIKSSSQYVCEDAYLVERIADHLLANGVVALPCAAGDTVYWINRVTKEIETDIVIAIHQYEDGFSITTKTIGSKCTSTYSLNRFLEIMFTKELAEKALKNKQ